MLPLVEDARLLAWEMPGYGRSSQVPAGVDISVGAQADRARESLAVHWEGYDHPGRGKALVRQMRSLDPGHTQAVAPALPAPGVPAALVWGAADRFQKLDSYGRRLARDLGASLDEVDAGKHFTPEDHPRRVAAAIDSIVAGARP